MRERGAFGFVAVMLIVTVLFFSAAQDETSESDVVNQFDGKPTIMINGRSFEPGYVEQGSEGRMIIVVDQKDLFIGENTVEIHWGDTPQTTLTAELPTDLQEH